MSSIPRTCAYCGLPAPRFLWDGAAEVEPSYCCYGCRFAANVSASDGDPAESRWMFTQLALALFCTMNVMAFTMALWSGDVYGADDSALAQTMHGIFRYLCMFFALPVFYFLGGPLLENAWDSSKRGIPNTDVLLVAGVSASFFFSVHSVFRDDGPVYFEVGCMILVLVTLGRWLEATGKRRATQALESLEKLLPENVCMIQDEREIDKPLSEIALGEKLRIRAGERIPCDGILLALPAHIDEQLLTGESRACTKEPGETLFAGTLNLDADLYLQVERLPQESTLARLVGLVRQAQQAKGRHEQLADRLATWFLPMVAMIALGATAYHGLHQGWGAGVLAGLSVVLIACPCALGIATPLAMWAALGEAARNRVLFQSGDALERLAKMNHLCFDKTGTLTTGSPIVSRIVFSSADDAKDGHARAFTLASASRHVFSQAIASHLHDQFGFAPAPSVIVQTVPGRGLRANWHSDNDAVVLGSERWMQELNLAVPDDLNATLARCRREGNAIVCLAWAGRVRGIFALAEEIRAETIEALSALKRENLGLTILTGDQTPLALSVGVEVLTGLLPEQKWQHLLQLRDGGKVFAMVGDGINDSPALAASDVGIAMGCGADIARDSAGVCLLDNDLRKIPWAIHLARQTVRIIRQNLFWAFVYNIIGIGLACFGLLNPVFAALAMVLSSFFVLGNSLRLHRRLGGAEVTQSETGTPTALPRAIRELST
jgi:heavy metal translocating P-type ATPase